MPEGDSERKAFKDYFDRSAAKALAKQIAAAEADFDQARFVRAATRNLKDLEFHDRVKQFSDSLAACLPDDRKAALAILTRSLPPAQPDCESVGDGWLQWPLGQFIADYGIDHFQASMKAMIELTQRFSAEFAVRPFVDRYPEKIFARLNKLASHKNPHVRRWCSEAVRTRLPWGMKLKALVADPTPILPVLDKLKDDSELYVRRSVANNLNDIAKDNPQVALDVCKRWSEESKEQRDWVIKHALRTMVKDGDPVALEIVGYGSPKQIEAAVTVKPDRIKIGESVEMCLSIQNGSRKPQDLIVDYVVHYVRKADKTGEKVFKWKNLSVAAGEEVSLRKKHSMKVTTIRALYPGVHRIEIQINGVRLAETCFTLA